MHRIRYGNLGAVKSDVQVSRNVKYISDLSILRVLAFLWSLFRYTGESSELLIGGIQIAG